MAVGGQLFGPGLPPQGARVEVELRAGVLTLGFADGRRDDVLVSSLRPRAGGWRGDALQLEWGDAASPFLLSVHDPIVVRALQAQLGARASHVRIAPSRAPRVGLVLVAGFAIALALGIALVVTQSSRLVDIAVRRIPVEWEVRLGELSLPAVLAGAEPLREGPVVQTVEDLGMRLVAQVDAPYDFKWSVVHHEQVNALALPGGQVVVFTGLVALAETPEELAGVLAHEIQHVVERHSLRAMVRGLGLRAVLGLLLGGAGDAGAHVAGLVEHLGSLRFSRAQEELADRNGLALLQRAGIDGRGMADFFERLAQKGVEPPALLSTHPASAERARGIREQLATSPDATPLPYDWPAVRAAASPSKSATPGW
jgi:predicted Zn-dependent protease